MDIVSIPDSIKLKPATSATITSVFIGLQLAGAIGMSIIFFTALFSQQVKRLASWCMFCASWAISCLSYALLFLAGQIHLSEPRKSICVTQAALMYSVPTLCVVERCRLSTSSAHITEDGLKHTSSSHSRMSLGLVAPELLRTTRSSLQSWYNVHFGLSRPPLETNARAISTVREQLSRSKLIKLGTDAPRAIDLV
ncbi:hypothetical protein EV361DRAFT_962316 [Lentinula raphanica]|nr:hypothetical protein EV361DRAFT_962316 [Lentinula raphanica]